MAHTSSAAKNSATRDVAAYKRHDNDTGSPDVQVAILSYEIEQLQAHLHNNHKDVDAKRSLLKKVARRKKYLKYLEQTQPERYDTVVKGLKLNKK